MVYLSESISNEKLHQGKIALYLLEANSIAKNYEHALLNSIMHVILKEEIYDEKYINKFTIGFEKLSKHRVAIKSINYLKNGKIKINRQKFVSKGFFIFEYFFSNPP